MSTFKKKYSFDQRLKESKHIKLKYPDRTPVIVSKCKNSTLNNITKHKYLVPNDLTMAHFIYVIRKRIKNLDPCEALYLYIENTLVTPSELIMVTSKNLADKDGFLYIEYTSEATFG
jgi:GABA(A) receptor-associated protein